MTTHVALLRAVNVAGHQPVAMADLRDLCTGLGFSAVRTVLQSGNVVLSGEAPGGAELEGLLEAQAETRLGLRTAFFARSAAQWEDVVAQNPFPGEARDDPGHLVVLFLKGVPAPGAKEALQAAITGRESVRVRDREVYLYYPDGIGRSRMTGARVERVLNRLTTGRNWNTVLKLRALVGR